MYSPKERQKRIAEKTAEANELLAKLVELSYEGYGPDNDKLVEYMHMCDSDLAEAEYGEGYYKHMTYARASLLGDLQLAVEDLFDKTERTEITNSKGL